ncbi:MAG: FHA domain-containing protein [Anaerolineae bacterium]
MVFYLHLELKEETGATALDDENAVQPIVCEIIEQVTLGRGEDPLLRTINKKEDLQSEAAFNRQMALLKNPLVDLTPFYAHDRGVSRKHARLTMRHTRLTIADLGSTNGTYVNNQRLEPNIEYPIKAGDELRLGFLALNLKLVEGQ